VDQLEWCKENERFRARKGPELKIMVASVPILSTICQIILIICLFHSFSLNLEKFGKLTSPTEVGQTTENMVLLGLGREKSHLQFKV